MKLETMRRWYRGSDEMALNQAGDWVLFDDVRKLLVAEARLAEKWRKTADTLSLADPRSYAHALALRDCADELAALRRDGGEAA